jgi:molybdate transport system regulatory protein
LSVRPELSLTAPHASPLGAERVRLLEAVGREGSISGAARAVGLSYTSAWHAILAMNDLAGRPLVAARPGGRRGGGARLTPEGVRLVEAFGSLQAAMARAFEALAPELEGEGAAAARRMPGGFLRTSARNALRGTVGSVEAGRVNARLGLELSEGRTIFASLTCRSLHELGLFPGRQATALIKAPLIELFADDPGLGCNRLAGTIRSLAPGEGAVEAILDIGGGKSLCAMVPDAAASGLVLGARAVAAIDPSHVILAVE